MPAATLENIESSTLSEETSYALNILKNLSIDQVNQLKLLMKLDKPGVIDTTTLTAFVQLCKDRGIDLSESGVNAFKNKHRLGNTGAAAGVIGRQTARVYFEEIYGDGEANQSSQPSEDLNQAILAAALKLRGMSSSDGPDGGNNACAWCVNRVLQKAGIAPLGDNQNLVSDILQDLVSGRGKQVSKAEAKGGDIVIANNAKHIGIGLDDSCSRVLSNSSSRARFVWESDTDFGGYYDGVSTIYRVLK